MSGEQPTGAPGGEPRGPEGADARQPGSGEGADARRPSSVGGTDAQQPAAASPASAAAPPRAPSRVAPPQAARAGGHRPAARGRGRLGLPIAVVTVAVLVLAGFFLLGTRLPGILTAAPAASPTPTQTPTATPTPTPTSTSGPQLAGTYDWNELRGGECINPFVSAWQQKFTVVDCQVPHGAQVMSTGALSTDPTAGYPGEDAIKQQLNLLCQIPANFNSAILGAYPDVVWQANYPVNAAQWQAGMRDYYCFVSRSSSGPITGDFAPAAFGG